MTPVFLLGILGLALLDSLNPATILTVGMILVLRERQRFATAISATLGAFGIVFGSGVAIYSAAQWSLDQISGLLHWFNTLVFVGAGLWLIGHGIARLRHAQRRRIHLPDWVSPSTGWFFGGFFTAADLPNAVPYLVAIERLVDVNAGPSAIWVILGYSVIYCLPCLILLALFGLNQVKMAKFLERMHDRFGHGQRNRSPIIAGLFMVAGLTVATLPFVLDL